MKYYWFFSLSLLFISYSLAQECTLSLSGKVSDTHDQSPLAFAIVKLVENQQYQEADIDGNYSFESLCPGNYTLEVSHASCNPIVKQLSLTKSQTLNFKLEHHIDQLNEIMLKAKLYERPNSTSLVKSVGKVEINKNSNLNFGELLGQLNGVSTLNTGAAISKPIIQGMHSSRVLVINNNVRMQDQQWGVDHAPNIDPNSAANIQVIRGASALRYGGDAVGGVIITTPQKAPVKDTLFGNSIFNFNSNGRGGGVTTSLLKSTSTGWYVKAQATAKRRGDLSAPNYTLSNTGMNENNFSIGFGLNKIDAGFNVYYSLFSTEIGILRASHIGNARDLANAINNSVPSFIAPFGYSINSPKQDVNHHLVKVDYFKKIKSFGELQIQYAYQNNRRKEFDVRRGNRSDRAALDLLLETHQLQSDLNIKTPESSQLNLGFELAYQDHFANPETGVRRLIPDYELFSAGAYITFQQELKDNLLFDTGLRYDYTNIDALKFYRTSRWDERGYQDDFSSIIIEDFGTQLLTNPSFQYHNISASLGLSYTFNSVSKLISNLSLATRNPNPSELFSDGLHHSTANIELGDLRLQQEKSYKLNASLVNQWSRFTLEINPYINQIYDFMTLEPNGIETTIRGAFPVFEYRQTQAFFAGLDTDFTYQINDAVQLKSQLSYTYAEDTNLNRPIIDIPPINTRTEFSYQIPKWNNLALKAVHEYVGKQNRFPDLDFSTPILNPETGELEETIIGISESPGAFQLVHLGLEMPFKFKHLDARVAFNVQNVFDVTYRNYLNRQRYYADELGRNYQLQIQLNY